MPKTTHAAGGTNALDESYLAAITEGAPTKFDEVGEQPSPGISSSTSTEKPEKTSDESGSESPKPAPTTARRFKRGQAVSSSADSTAGSTESESSE